MLLHHIKIIQIPPDTSIPGRFAYIRLSLLLIAAIFIYLILFERWKKDDLVVSPLLGVLSFSLIRVDG